MESLVGIFLIGLSLTNPIWTCWIIGYSLKLTQACINSSNMKELKCPKLAQSAFFWCLDWKISILLSSSDLTLPNFSCEEYWKTKYTKKKFSINGRTHRCDAVRDEIVRIGVNLWQTVCLGVPSRLNITLKTKIF